MRWCGAIVLLAVVGCTSQSGETAKKKLPEYRETLKVVKHTPEELKAGRYIILENGHSPFWDVVKKGIDQAAKDFEVNAVLEQNDATPAGQISKLQQFASQGDIVAVGVSATDAANPAIADEMENLKKKGIQVVSIDADLDRDLFRDRRFAFVGTDNVQAGEELGKAAKNLRNGKGNYVTFVGRTASQNAMDRTKGFQMGAGAGFKSLDNMGDENDRTKARENVRNALHNHPDLNTLVGIWSYNGPAIVDILHEPGHKREDFTVLTFDAEALAISEMDKGDIDVMLVQNPYKMGYEGVRLMKALVEDDQATVKKMFPKYGQPDGDLYNTGLKVVVPENSPLKADSFEKTTEFFKLDAFRKWLKELDLESS